MSVVYKSMIALVLLFFGGTVSMAEDAPRPGNEITGAGAHFSWIVFNELKADLENKFGRTLKLYGRGSMLGAGCNAGIKTAKKNKPGAESFGFVCCPLGADEVNNEGLVVHDFAIEPIVILVHRDNPVTNLSSSQVRAIFRGDITNWAEVGGADKPIVVVTRLHCKQRPGHWKTILPAPALFRKDRLNVRSAAEMVKRVGDFTEAIGHTGATWNFDDHGGVKVITVDGNAPNAANLKAKSYPFYRTLSAVTHGTISKELKGMLKEVQKGPGFRKLADRYGLLPTH
ncbi:MAG: hypothetical protein BMS9Abin36_2056 [Gammaproteobacteria bacterium]|nr:MAG: hypothetical protein BMS9Abin36_2056 [Gammaproteobacteria bacterium]